MRELSDRIVGAQTDIRVLESVKWTDEVRAQFFADGFGRQPMVDRSY
ncbi:MAG: hypothetical protein O3C27_15195 [Actinomycetota bacterium]|nr:hypothetical protein [Actinomycetota bacterium]